MRKYTNSLIAVALLFGVIITPFVGCAQDEPSRLFKPVDYLWLEGVWVSEPSEVEKAFPFARGWKPDSDRGKGYFKFCVFSIGISTGRNDVAVSSKNLYGELRWVGGNGAELLVPDMIPIRLFKGAVFFNGLDYQLEKLTKDKMSLTSRKVDGNIAHFISFRKAGDFSSKALAGNISLPYPGFLKEKNSEIKKQALDNSDIPDR